MKRGVDKEEGSRKKFKGVHITGLNEEFIFMDISYVFVKFE